MRKLTTTAVALLVTVVLVGGLAVAGADDKDTIKKVMKAAMKGGLNKKVASGKATQPQKEELLSLYEDLAKATPPKGDPASWKDKTGALVVAAKGAVDGKANAGAALGKAANCKACHDMHKGQ